MAATLCCCAHFFFICTDLGSRSSWLVGSQSVYAVLTRLASVSFCLVLFLIVVVVVVAHVKTLMRSFLDLFQCLLNWTSGLHHLEVQPGH